MGEDLRKVLVLYTGGTIGMQQGEDGALKPSRGYLKAQMDKMSELQAENMPRFDVMEFDPLLDSSDMSLEDWCKIAKFIEDNYYDYTGFVVLHGTDTMAYSASALSFMFENLGKPVVFTGAMIPLYQVVNDAKRNLIMSIIIAGTYDFCEVVVFFNKKMIRGCRATKVDAWGLNAFDSPNLEPLATLGVSLRFNERLLQPPPKGRFRVVYDLEPRVAVIHLLPGFNEELLENFLRPPVRGVVLRTFGVGNAPLHKTFLATIRNAVSRGVAVVVVTQCHRGTVRDDYETGVCLREAGALSGTDMTTEAAATKLHHLLATCRSQDEVRARMRQSLRGELFSDHDEPSKKSNPYRSIVLKPSDPSAERSVNILSSCSMNAKL